MSEKRRAFTILAFILLAVNALACNVPTPTRGPQGPQGPPPTVTPYIPPTTPPLNTQPPLDTQPPPATSASPTTSAPPATTPSPEPPETTSSPEPPTYTAPPPTSPPSTPIATAEPTQATSAGPLDFVPPTWVHSWEPLPEGRVLMVLKITITGGAPPFTIKHGLTEMGQTMEREFLIELEKAGCSGIGETITVESADGQSVDKIYWLSTDEQPWCQD